MRDVFRDDGSPAGAFGSNRLTIWRAIAAYQAGDTTAARDVVAMAREGIVDAVLAIGSVILGKEDLRLVELHTTGFDYLTGLVDVQRITIEAPRQLMSGQALTAATWVCMAGLPNVPSPIPRGLAREMG